VELAVPAGLNRLPGENPPGRRVPPDSIASFRLGGCERQRVDNQSRIRSPVRHAQGPERSRGAGARSYTRFSTCLAPV